MPQLLRKLKLSHGQVKVESTPRRLAVIVESVQAKQEDAEERVRGPPAKVRLVDCAINGNIMTHSGNSQLTLCIYLSMVHLSGCISGTLILKKMMIVLLSPKRCKQGNG